MAAQEKGRHEDRISEETVFKAAKEIVVKFIEVGKVSPGGFDDVFPKVYQSLRRAVRPK